MAGLKACATSGSRYCCGVSADAARFPPVPKILRPSDIVIVAWPTFIELALFARMPLTVTRSPTLSVSFRHP
jgi:hypothetical protein